MLRLIRWSIYEICLEMRTPSSIEFHVIPWNCSCHQNWRTPSSMKFHGTAHLSEIGTLQVPWNSMELLVSAKLAHSKRYGIPWNWNLHSPSSMEFYGIFLFGILWNHLYHQYSWVINLDRIPWNLSFHILKKIIFNFAGCINFRKLISTLYLFVSVFHQLMFY